MNCAGKVFKATVRLWPASFLHSRRPVDHHCQRRVRLRLHYRVDQKTLPIACCGIGGIEGLNSPGAEIEERNRRANLEALAAPYRRRHQLPVSRVVEQLTPIPPPAWTAAPAGRYLPLASASGVALHIDLILT